MPTHSFNFGIGGMYLPETAYLLEQILNLKPRNLKWVFIEYDELQTKWSPENQTSRRALYWADWKRVSLLLRKLTDAGTDPLWLPSPAKLRDIVLRQKDEKNTRSLLTFYAGQFEKNYTNVARAADVLQYFLGRDTKERRASYLGAASDGYVTRPNRMSPSRLQNMSAASRLRWHKPTHILFHLMRWRPTASARKKSGKLEPRRSF